jgi:hypothetical protein
LEFQLDKRDDNNPDGPPSGTLSLVQEYLCRGSLFDVLRSLKRKKKRAQERKHKLPGAKKLPLRQLSSAGHGDSGGLFNGSEVVFFTGLFVLALLFWFLPSPFASLGLSF